MPLYYTSQYFSTTLNVGGGIDDTQTTGITVQSVSGLDITKPGIACISYSDPLDTATAEWVTYTSINGSNVLQGVTRGAEGYSAKTHSNGATIVFPLSKSHINNINDWLQFAPNYAADAGSTDDYAVTLSPVPLAYTTGMVVHFKAATINTGAATLNVNSLGAKTIKKNYNSDLASGDILANQLVSVIYDGTNFEMLSPVANASAGGTAFWSDVPGTPTRVSDTQFTITDTSNANLYDLLFKKGTILRWLESTTFQTAMVISSSYGTNTVTINIVGDSLTAGFTSMKYAIPEALTQTFIIPGTLAALTDAAKTWYTESGVYILSADAYVKTAGTTNSTVFDINDDGSTKFTTKPTITTGTTSDIDNVADNPSTEVAAGSLVTVDIDSVSTTAPIEAYIKIFYYPSAWRYRS